MNEPFIMTKYKTKSDRVLGIDPGLSNTGFAVVVRNARGAFSILESGCIATDKNESEANRAKQIYQQIRDVIHQHTPDLIAVERVYFNRNPSSCLSTAGISYVCLLAAELSCVPSVWISPQTAKAAATGFGSASKESVRKFIYKLTGETLTNSHQADAAAVAIAGLLKARSEKATLA